jgi:hypothetical protein
MPDPIIAPEATIVVRHCKCGSRWSGGNTKYCPSGHAYAFTERVYVDLAALDPDALARKFEEERVTSLEVRLLREFARWLGLGDNDAD